MKTLLAIASAAVFVAAVLGAGNAAACGEELSSGDAGTACGDSGKAKTSSAAAKAFDKAPATGTKAVCPVMDDEIKVAADSERSEHRGKHYAFCCKGCKSKFDANPEKYAN